jgi:hypothetical protein
MVNPTSIDGMDDDEFGGGLRKGAHILVVVKNWSMTGNWD